MVVVVVVKVKVKVKVKLPLKKKGKGKVKGKKDISKLLVKFFTSAREVLVPKRKLTWKTTWMSQEVSKRLLSGLVTTLIYPIYNRL